MRKLVTLAAFTILTTGMSSSAFAGEVTGQTGQKIRTGAPAHANSICAYSGLEDGTTLVSVDANGNMTFVYDTPTGPGIVQTPHSDGGMIHDPGIPGTACRGFSNPENPPL
ncbi:hypothetical protein [Sphingomonas sp.]|uniref:hypothetical protein n=1 Tax=Sphingomonas sp. TaxID=28214 RepID=UPI0038ACE4B4